MSDDQLPVAVSEDEAEDLGKLLSVRIQDVNQFETAFSEKVELALEKHEQARLASRLHKCRDSIRQIEESVAKGVSSSKLSKLNDRLSDLRAEEEHLNALINGDRELHDVSSEKSAAEEFLGDRKRLKELFEDDANEAGLPPATRPRLDHQISDETSTPELESVNAEAEDALQRPITDDSQRGDFTRRIDEWLACEDFSGWRACRTFFADFSLEEQCQFTLPCPNEVESLLDGAFSVPKCLWGQLFEYQKEGVKWMLRLHQADRGGGILGDEMGLGKTVQVIAYISALQLSGQLTAPGLIVVPSTLLRQWIREIHAWWPALRVVLLHSTSQAFQEARSARYFYHKFTDRVHVFVTSYGTAVGLEMQRLLSSQDWSFAVLDEGHKIRNPDAQVSLICKQLRTRHRFVLSGTPIQNNLTELWSLLDFACPGRLGSLQLFKQELAQPINAGGYTNATLFQVQTSYKCACVLRDLIKPFLLRRLKRNVLASSAAGNGGQLPEKREDIIFCQITSYQRRLYETFLESAEVEAIVERRRNVLAGIDVLRKLCNHPDLLELFYSDERREQLFEDAFEPADGDDASDARDPYADEGFRTIVQRSVASVERPLNPRDRSGKLAVLEKILELWKRRGHRALIFCQTRQMLDLLEVFISSLRPASYQYLRMDGKTPIKQRLELVDQFNATDSKYFLFLLTTRVGGLGINLTGADRVIIYDPDWNPSTDMQARERVYRLGQRKAVSIIRLLTAGTIEEKIYHRQLFKQLLQQRILEDPKQTRFFRTADLYDLFSLSEDGPASTTETADMLGGLEEELARSLNRAQASPDNSSKDDGILSDLLNVAGVHSAMSTDSVSEQARPELELVQKEADRVAQEALRAIQDQIAQTSTTVAAPSKWAGRFGSTLKAATASENPVKAAISAREILAAIEARKQAATGGISSSLSIKLALGIVDYMVRIDPKNTGVDSNQLARAFNRQIQASEEAILFRAILKNIAVFDRGRRRWSLKPEFRKK